MDDFDSLVAPEDGGVDGAVELGQGGTEVFAGMDDVGFQERSIVCTPERCVTFRACFRRPAFELKTALVASGNGWM
jgi:hypothetical protein